MTFAVLGDATRSTTGTGGDYCLKNGTTLLSSNTVTIGAGQTYVDITLQPYDDGIHKPTKTASMLLETGTGYDLAQRPRRASAWLTKSPGLCPPPR